MNMETTLPAVTADSLTTRQYDDPFSSSSSPLARRRLQRREAERAADGPSDAVLVARAQAGSAAAFEQIVERYRTRIYRYLTARLHDAELAADLTQETFLDAWRCLDRLTDGSGLLRWLYRIARNNLLPEWRRRSCASLDLLCEESERAIVALSQPDETPACHERALIESVLGQLGEASGTALRYAMHGCTSDEVGQILGISGEAARRRISRAKHQFRHSYQAA